MPGLYSHLPYRPVPGQQLVEVGSEEQDLAVVHRQTLPDAVPIVGTGFGQRDQNTDVDNANKTVRSIKYNFLSSDKSELARDI